MGERLGDNIVVDVDMGAVWLRRVGCAGLDLRECTLQKDEGGAIDVCICKAQNRKRMEKIVRCVTRWFVGRRDECKPKKKWKPSTGAAGLWLPDGLAHPHGVCVRK